MTTGFQINGSDWDDLFVRKSTFTEGGLWMWGLNTSGQLGIGNIVHRSSPVQILSGGSTWKQISSSKAGSFSGGIKSDGSLWMWGGNNLGQLGNTTRTSRSSPIQTITGGKNWKQLAIAGAGTTGAIKTDGTIWTWGLNDKGQMGDGTSTNRSSPVQTVAGDTNWKFVSAGRYGFQAIKTDGTLWLWGGNLTGALGDATNQAGKSSPVQTVAGGNNWKMTAGGHQFSAAIKTDGTLWLWGQNHSGQLGDTTIVHRSSPVQTVAGGTNWRFVACGNYSTGAIKTDGTLWLWGSGLNGRLGNNSTISRSSPVQTVSGGTNWKQLTLGNEASHAIKTDGTLWAWGSNSNGELANGTVTSKSSPIQTLMTNVTWKQVVSGERYAYAIIEDYF